MEDLIIIACPVSENLDKAAALSVLPLTTPQQGIFLIIHRHVFRPYSPSVHLKKLIMNAFMSC